MAPKPSAHSRPTLLALAALLLGACAVPTPPVLRRPDSAPGVPESVLNSVIVYGSANAMCSAVVVGPHQVMTARHCVEAVGDDPAAYTVALDGTLRLPESVEVSPFEDMALLTTGEPAFARWAELGQAELPAGVEGWVAGYGCPLGSGVFELAVRPVHYVRRQASLEPDLLIEDKWRGRICHGDSGGGTFDDAGLLVGINYAMGTGEFNSGMMYTVPPRLGLEPSP
jgi:S1-C subfamily serine protease